MQRWIILTACLLVTACSPRSVIEKLSSPEDRKLSQDVVASLQAGDIQAVVALMPPAMRAQAAVQLPKAAAATPSGSGQSAELVDAGFQAIAVGGQTTRTSYLVYEVVGGPRRALVETRIERRAAQAFVIGINVVPIAKPLREIQRFGFVGKSPAQYAFLLLGAASLVTCLTSLVLLMRTPGVRRKWLWAIGCAVGFCMFTIDWSTGAITFNLLMFELLGFGVAKIGVLSSWRVSFGLPIVAVLFLFKRQTLRGSASGLKSGEGPATA